jgi:hypothetical protein
MNTMELPSLAADEGHVSLLRCSYGFSRENYFQESYRLDVSYANINTNSYIESGTIR